PGSGTLEGGGLTEFVQLGAEAGPLPRRLGGVVTDAGLRVGQAASQLADAGQHVRAIGPGYQVFEDREQEDAEELVDDRDDAVAGVAIRDDRAVEVDNPRRRVEDADLARLVVEVLAMEHAVEEGAAVGRVAPAAS